MDRYPVDSPSNGGAPRRAIPSSAGATTLRSTATSGKLRVGVTFILLAFIATIGIVHAGGSSRLIFAVLGAVLALSCLHVVTRPCGIFSLGGITLVMVGVLFIARWFFPPVANDLITPLGAMHYDRDGALVASSVMACAFAAAYSIALHLPFAGPRPAPSRRSASIKGGSGDLIVAAIVLILIRLVTGVLFHVGIPGQKATPIPLLGVVYYISTYGPLAAAALILWLGSEEQVSTFAAGAILLCDIVAESLLGSHGTPFLAALVFAASRSGAGRPIRLTVARLVPLATLLSVVLASALVISFAARRTLNGGARQSVVDVPAFVFNRLGGLEYLAPVVGAVHQSGSDLHRLRSSTWNNFLTVDVYGLPAGTQTGFAATAVGWWYGLGGLEGVLIGAAASGLGAGIFDHFISYGTRRRTPVLFIVGLGVLLGWATFLLGGTIGSLGGISVGFSVTALALLGGHQLVLLAASRSTTRRHSSRGPAVPSFGQTPRR